MLIKLYGATGFVTPSQVSSAQAAEQHLFSGETVWDSAAIEMSYWYNCIIELQHCCSSQNSDLWQKDPTLLLVPAFHAGYFLFSFSHFAVWYNTQHNC